MKKSIIALAVAGAMAAPLAAQADATLYGSLAIAAEKGENSAGADVNLNVYDYLPSRVGIKGTADTGIDGVTAVYQAEWKVNTDAAQSASVLGNRLGYVGLTGDFGTFAVGAQWSPYFQAIDGLADLTETNGGISDHFRLSQVVAYVTPNMGGFQAKIAAVADAGDLAADANEDVSAYNLAAFYTAGALKLAATTLTMNDAADTDKFGLAAQYTAGPMTLAASFEDNDTTEQWEIGAAYAVSDATTLTLDYKDLDNDANQTLVEVKQMLGKKTRVFAQYVYADAGATDGSKVVAGMRVDF